MGAWRESAYVTALGFQYILWTDATIEQLVAQHYPQLLSVYRGYPSNIQRADVARYVILHHVGGIYADIDCFPAEAGQANFSRILADGVLAAHSLLLLHKPHSVPQHFMAAARGHLFYAHVLARLPAAARRWAPTPYQAVFITTGPFFHTEEFVAWACGQARAPGPGVWEGIRWLDESGQSCVDVPGQWTSGCFAWHAAGRTWHRWDGQLVNALADRFGDGDAGTFLYRFALTCAALLPLVGVCAFRRGPCRALLLGQCPAGWRRRIASPCPPLRG